MLTSSSSSSCTNYHQQLYHWPSHYSTTTSPSLDAATTPNESSTSLLWPTSGGLVFDFPSVINDQGNIYTDDINMYFRSDEPQKSNVTCPTSNSSANEVIKKSHHNIKEKLRRMKLNDAYSSLKSLLPDSYKIKKKWSAPLVVETVLDYIPELQDELEKLRQKKEEMLLIIQKKQIISSENQLKSDFLVPTVSTSEIEKGEYLGQICVRKDRGQVNILSNLLVKLEEEGIEIVSSSTLSISTHVVCFHLHMKGTKETSNYADILRDKMVSWLCQLLSTTYSS